MATAEYVTKVHAVCTHTGNLAHYSFRKAQNDDLVMLGETQEYEPLSRAAYYKAIALAKQNIEKVKNSEKDSKIPEKNYSSETELIMYKAKIY